MLRSSDYIRKYLLFFAIYGTVMALYLWLTRSNSVPGSLTGTAADPATFMNAEELRISEIYSAERNWLFFVSYPWEWGVYIILLFTGWASRLEQRLETKRWPLALRFTMYVTIINGAAFAALLPLRFVGYRLSRSYGISTQLFGSWLRDKLVAFGIDTVTLLAITAVAFWFIRRGGRWWLKLWLLSIPFTLFMMYIQPVVIDPLFNRFTGMSDPVLERKILDLADQAGVPADRVYVADMSEKTNALNAYVNGIGSNLRIVLWDTLFRLEEKEILQVVAHEIGHYDMHHLEWSAFGAVVSSFFILAIGSIALRWAVRRGGKLWGLRSAGDLAAIPLILLLISVFAFASLPLSNYISRKAESEADVYALRLIGSAEGAVSMTRKMAKVTYDDVDPPLLVKWFRDTHPSVMERIRRAEQFERIGR